MAVTFISRDERLSVFLWKIEEELPILLKSAALTPDEQVQYEAFRAESRKRQWLTVRALANKVFGHKATITYSAAGRPSLGGDGAYISISHADAYAAITIGGANHIGVDVESINRKYTTIRHKFASDDEAAIFTASGFEESLYLPIIWCAKEAAFKAADCTDVDFIRDVVITRVEANETFTAGEVEVRFNPLRAAGMFKFTVIDNHVIAWGKYEGV
ncbi:4'-phosphopantetheinyl transferase superfamily protein [uncultured Acetobacteroides sp.]|uniref:4'-phosphopantetheinyl transferase family protein n=1 Tax=uncultured Acetobacteroides sp. TaxID=1760811 RepID=UPI0029F487D4|nr:4'-phosphopantetheinyl transferase superfamily protein [uncultured Acetobacteroides sp.]